MIIILHFLPFRTQIKRDVALWKRIRFERNLADFLLREGHYDTAILLAKDSGVLPLVNADMFVACRDIESALKRRDCGPALAWCAEHKQRLTKLNSSLEFKLRLQEFVEVCIVFLLMLK